MRLEITFRPAREFPIAKVNLMRIIRIPGAQHLVMRGSNILHRLPRRVPPSYFVLRHNSTVSPIALIEQRGRRLTPWLRAMKEIRQRGANPPPELPRAELTPKLMNESHYAIKLPFSTDEVSSLTLPLM